MFSVECSQINLVPVNFSFASVLSNVDVWCPALPSPNVTLTFTEPYYLLYIVIRRIRNSNVTTFSLSYENSSSENVTYVNVDGVYVRHLTAVIALFSYVFYSCLENNMTLMIIVLFYCGHQSILAKYNSFNMGILLSLVVLELTFMDVHTVKVCSYIAGIAINRVDYFFM